MPAARTSKWPPQVSERLAPLGALARHSGAVAWRAFTPPWEVQAIVQQSWRLFARCALPVVAVIFPSGMVLALQGLAIFDLFGAQRLLSSLVAVSVFRELAPVLSSLLVAAQGGSTIAAELGAMRLREELDATAVMAIDPIRVHVVPRVWAVLIAAPALELLGAAAGILGGWTVAVGLQGEANGVWWANLWGLTQPLDVVGGMGKAVVFAALIASLATWHGIHASGGAAGVGRAVNDTVVQSIVGFIVVNYFLTSALFGAM